MSLTNAYYIMEELLSFGEAPGLGRRELVHLRLEFFLRRLLEVPITLLIRTVLPDYKLTNYTICGDRSRVRIAATADVANTLFNVSSGEIVVEDYAFFGHNVCIITGVHDYTQTCLDRQRSVPYSGHDVIIKKGAWIASNVTVLGPCVIGENAVIGAGSVINKDIPPDTICLPRGTVTMKKIEYQSQR
jgi:acetyltransferase-like isoleucine patch superfamily enzyme